MNEVEVLTNEREIVLKGEKIVITPYSWINTIKMAKPLTVVLKAISENFVNFKNMADGIDENNQFGSFVNILETINRINEADKLVEAIQELIATGIKRDKEIIADLDFEELFEVGKAVFEVNKDFFVKIMNKIPASEEKIQTPEM